MSTIRSFIPGVSVHVVQRGNNRMTVFQKPADFATFLVILRHAAGHFPLAVHGFALMTTHVHLMVTPDEPNAIPKMMQAIGLKYVRYYNRSYERTGTLWNGRYRAKIIDDAAYSLTCLRYVDRNPVNAKIVATPEEYRWSSYLANGFGEWPNWLTPHPDYLALGGTVEDRASAYRQLCAVEIDEVQVAALRCDDDD